MCLTSLKFRQQLAQSSRRIVVAFVRRNSEIISLNRLFNLIIKLLSCVLASSIADCYALYRHSSLRLLIFLGAVLFSSF